MYNAFCSNKNVKKTLTNVFFTLINFIWTAFQNLKNVVT